MPFDDMDLNDNLDQPRIWRANDLSAARQTEWLAQGRIPLNAVSLLVGDEGIGKSLWWVWVAAAVSTGNPLPEFGIPRRDPGTVVLVLTEDEWAYTVRPRLEVAGADLDHILVICTDSDGSGAPMFPRDMPLIVEAQPTFVVVDAFLDTVDRRLSMKDPQQARLALHPWKEAASATGAAITLLTHTNRVDSKSARDKYGISGELRKKARVTLYAQEDEEGHLVIGPEKSNISRKIPASLFRIDSVPVWQATDDDDGTVPNLVFVGESDKTAREHLEANFDAAHADGEGEDRNEAEAWLEDYLTANGSAPSTDVKTAARKAGISERSVKRAAQSIDVAYEQKGFPRRTWWSLPSEASRATSENTPPVSCPTGPTGPTESDKGKQVGPTVQTLGLTVEPLGPTAQTEPQWGQLGQLGHPKSNGPTGVPTGPTGEPIPFGSCRIHGTTPKPDACWTCEDLTATTH